MCLFSFSQTICFVSFESTSKFVWSFIKNVHWILSNSFYVMILWFSSFILLMWCITLIDLWILKHSCILGKKSTWLWCIILFRYCWIQFVITCWGFCIYIHQKYWPIIFFLCSIFLWFWYQGGSGLREWF